MKEILDGWVDRWIVDGWIDEWMVGWKNLP
jgi:hypothetical protein